MNDTAIDGFLNSGSASFPALSNAALVVELSKQSSPFHQRSRLRRRCKKKKQHV
jgi:hypothetical protein